MSFHFCDHVILWSRSLCFVVHSALPIVILETQKSAHLLLVVFRIYKKINTMNWMFVKIIALVFSLPKYFLVRIFFILYNIRCFLHVTNIFFKIFRFMLLRLHVSITAAAISFKQLVYRSVLQWSSKSLEITKSYLPLLYSFMFWLKFLLSTVIDIMNKLLKISCDVTSPYLAMSL